MLVKLTPVDVDLEAGVKALARSRTSSRIATVASCRLTTCRLLLIVIFVRTICLI